MAVVLISFQRKASGDLAEKSHKDGDEPFFQVKPNRINEYPKELYQDYLIYKEQKEKKSIIWFSK